MARSGRNDHQLFPSGESRRCSNQLALTLDTIRDIFRENEGELDRRLRSAIRGIRQSLHTELDPTVRSLLKIYGASDETHPLWIDRVDGWAEKGRTQRHQEGG